ncbi:hypothetical protein U1Q18_038726 [Sarracenia purpurea var. burkii]
MHSCFMVAAVFSLQALRKKIQIDYEDINGGDRLVVTRLTTPSSLDIGNENCVIAVVKQRGIDVLLNDESGHETPVVVSFGEKQRFMGAAGAASATMNPKSTIS